MGCNPQELPLSKEVNHYIAGQWSFISSRQEYGYVCISDHPGILWRLKVGPVDPPGPEQLPAPARPLRRGRQGRSRQVYPLEGATA